VRAGAVTWEAPTLLGEPWTIQHNGWLTRDTFELELRHPGGHAFAFVPGQFNMVYAFGAGEVPLSISGDPARPELLVHTVRSVGPSTRSLSRLKEGEQVFVRGPYGAGWPLERALGKDLLLCAGGIGLAPLRPVILEVVRRRHEFANVAVAYGAKRPLDLLFVKELEQLAEAHRIQLEITVDAADDAWLGATGVVTKLLPNLHIDLNNAVAMVCGPEVMMRFVARELEELGLPFSRVFVSTERSMKCGVGLCGHCQLGPFFVCKDGPVFNYETVSPLLLVPEL
jgi:NAD(P)H-flavin reductase